MNSFGQSCSFRLGLLATACLAVASVHSTASVIDFDSEGYAGPSTFAAASPVPQSITINAGGVNVTFSGGVILTAATGLVIDTTSIYGSASFVSGMSNPMRITFSQPVQNFYMTLFNGQNTSTSYKVADNAGNSANFNLVPNTSSGNTLVGFAATGTEVDISDTSSVGSWDFEIDNIHFNEPLPSSLGVPDAGGSLGLLATALSSLLILARGKAFAKL